MFSFWKALVVPAVVVGAGLVAEPQSAQAQGFGISLYSGNPGYYGSPYTGGYGSYRAYYGGNPYSPYTSFNSYGVPYGGYYRGGHHHHHHHCR